MVVSFILIYCVMTTCECDRCSAYSEDLHWRIIWQKCSRKKHHSHSTKFRNSPINYHSHSHVVSQYWISNKKVYPTLAAFRKVNAACGLYILNLVTQKPEMYLHEIRQELEEMLFVNVSLSTIFRFLRENKFTRQRLRNIALQRDAFARELYVSEVSVYSSDMFIFVNETGADQRNTLRKHGYSVRRNASSKSFTVH